MKILMAYGTTEGHTQNIAEAINKLLGSQGHSVVKQNMADMGASIAIDAFDRVIVAGSVHEQRHQQSLRVFVAAHKQRLEQVPTLLLSVSLAAASPTGKEQVQSYIDILCSEAEWTPAAVYPVGGALRHDQYDYFSAQTLEWSVPAYRELEGTEADHVYTDWPALFARVEKFITDPAS
jgi:menaquinone-dependent protoporphyrinogen oxidase